MNNETDPARQERGLAHHPEREECHPRFCQLLPNFSANMSEKARHAFELVQLQEKLDALQYEIYLRDRFDKHPELFQGVVGYWMLPMTYAAIEKLAEEVGELFTGFFGK